MDFGVLDLKSLSIFVKVAEQRSFARAARSLGMTQSGVSNAIARLETQLDVRLLARTTRRVNLTEDGAALLDRSRRILTELEEAELTLGRSRVTPTGRLRVDLPVSFGRLKIVPLLGAFQAKYPDVTLALSFTDRYVDLVEEAIDVAVRMGTLQDSTLVARKLTTTRFRVFGAPGYLAKRGRPRVIDDLRQHECLAFTFRDTSRIREWRFRSDGTDQAVIPHGKLSFTDGGAICAAACAGYGLVQMHDYYADALVAAGALETVLERFEPPADTVSLVYPTARHLSAKVRAFVDFVSTQLLKETSPAPRAAR